MLLVKSQALRRFGFKAAYLIGSMKLWWRGSAVGDAGWGCIGVGCELRGVRV